MAMSLLPLTADMTLTDSSGIDVPTATTVSPTINSGMPRRSARATAPSVSSMAPMTITASPMARKM